MTEPAEDRLMRYLDGEASEAEAVEVERWLEESAEARALAGDLSAIGDAVRAIADEQGAPADGIADSVMRQIERDRAVAAPVVPMARARDKAVARKTSRLVPAIGLSLAAAAAIALYIKAKPVVPDGPVAIATGGTVQPAQPGEPPTASAPSEMAAASSDEGPGAAIESVDFGSQNGTIFLVAHGPETTPVVWLVDDGEATEG